MQLWEKIIQAYPEIKSTDNFIELGIVLEINSNENEAFIAEWEYSKPLPEGMKVGKN